MDGDGALWGGVSLRLRLADGLHQANVTAATKNRVLVIVLRHASSGYVKPATIGLWPRVD